METNLLQQFWSDAQASVIVWAWAASAVFVLTAHVVFASRKVTVSLVGACLLVMWFIALFTFDASSELALFSNLVSIDPLTQILNLITLLIASGVFAISLPGLFQTTRVFKDNYHQYPEFLICLLLSGFGVSVAVSAIDLTSFFLGFESLAIGTYAMCGFFRSQLRSTEAALKYLFLGAFTTVVFLWGIAMLYGATGFTSYADIQSTIVASPAPFVVLACVFIVAGLAFKLALVPFHFYAPEVYEGAPTPVTAFMATAMKLAVVGAGLRLFWGVLEPVAENWQPLWLSLCVVSILVANIWALRQRTIKKLLAFSSVAHAGYIGLALLVADPSSSEWALFPVITYLLIYSLMSLGLFAVVTYIENRDEFFAIEDLKGYASKNLGLSIIFSVFVVGMAGFPPLAGFVIKLLVFQSLVAQGYVLVALLAVVGSIIGAVYYLRLLMMIFMSGDEKGAAHSWSLLPDPIFSLRTLVALCLLVTLLGGLLPGLYSDRILEALGRSVVSERSLP